MPVHLINSLQKKTIALCLSSFLLASTQANSAPRLERLLADTTEAVFLIEDTPKLINNWPQHPLAKVWNHEEVDLELTRLKQWLQLSSLDNQVIEATGESLSSLLNLLSGQTLLTIADINSLATQDALSTLATAFIATVADDPDQTLDQLLTHFMTKALPSMQAEQESLEDDIIYRVFEEDYFDETLYIQQRVADFEVTDGAGWVLIDDILIVAQPKQYLQELVAAVKQGEATTPWSDSDAYRQLGSADNDITLYINGENIADTIITALTSAGDEDSPRPEMEFFGHLLTNLLGDNLDMFYASSQLNETATTVDINLLFHESSQGLLNLLAYQPGPVELPTFLPHNTETVSFSHFSISEMWSAVSNLASSDPQINMALAMVKAQIQQFSERTGVDLEQALLNSIGNRWLEITLSPESTQPGTIAEENSFLYGISVNDQQTLEMALEAIKAETGLAGFLERREYLGTAFFAPKTTANPDSYSANMFPMAYAISNDYLLISNRTQTLQQMLAALKNQSSLETVNWLQAATQEGISQLPPDASAISLFNPATLLNDAVSSAGFFQSRLPRPEYEQNMCGTTSSSSSLAPDHFEDLLNTAVSGIYKQDNLFRLIYQLQHHDL